MKPKHPIWHQVECQLTPKPRGFHLITQDIYQQVPELQDISRGIVHLQLMHTSASLTLNENADPTVRLDFEQVFNRLVKEREPYYEHTYEGPDDLPAHIKTSLLGSSLTLSVTQGVFVLGTWQGIYLGEHRNHGGSRRLVATLNGI